MNIEVEKDGVVLLRGARRVYVDGLEYGPKPVTFAVGDIVRVSEKCPPLLPLAGAVGRVVCVRPRGFIGVEFGRAFGGGHNCDGASAPDRGRYFYPSSDSCCDPTSNLGLLERVETCDLCGQVVP